MSTRRITKPYPMEIYELLEWDGGDGRTNSRSGFITSQKAVAEKWKSMHTGRSYRTISGLHISRLADIPGAEETLARITALNKLTDKEQKLLGLK